jgi:very-short-patch-repair endonuclease
MHNRSALLQVRARQHRHAPVPSEAALWRLLSGGKLGVGFRRQIVIGRYIVDFVAPGRRVVVEVDGGYHARRRGADARRDRELAALGYRVLRLGGSAGAPEAGRGSGAHPGSARRAAVRVPRQR